MGLEPRGAASAKDARPRPSGPAAAECPSGLGQLAGAVGWAAGFTSGIGVAPRCPLPWGAADGQPDTGNPYVRLDEGSLRKQVLLYVVPDAWQRSLG